jgi:hypothetical protein
VQRVSNGQILWTANAVDAYGHVTDETLGNGLVSRRSYDDAGRPSIISAGTPTTVNTAAAVQYQSVGYNAINQVTSKYWINAGLGGIREL